MAAKNKNTFTPLKLDNFLITNADKNLGEFVSKVEKLKGKTFYRITFMKEDAPAFITFAPYKEEKKAVFLHYCEQNERGIQCSHLARGAAIGKRLGFDVEFSSAKTTADYILDKNAHDDKDYDVLNGRDAFADLVQVVEEEPEEEPTTTPAPSASKKKSSTPAKPAKKRNWKTGWKEVEDYLIEEGATNRILANIQQKRKSVYNSVALTTSASAPVKPETPYKGSMILRAIRHILNGSDIILIGEKGSGKDTMIATIAWVFGYPTTLVTGNGDEDKESLICEPAFIDNESTHVKSDFTKSVENGDLVNFAEINMLQGDVTSVFHSLLDDNQAIPTKLGLVKRHPEHLIIGSMNVGEGYAGVKELNEAFKDRFSMMRLPYGDFRSIIKSKSGLTNKSALDFLESVKNAIDKLIAANDGEGSSAKTIRGYIKAAKYLKDFGTDFDTKVEAIEDYVINRITDFEELCAVRETIREFAWKDFPISQEEELHINAGGL